MDAIDTILSLAASTLDEHAVADWTSKRIEPGKQMRAVKAA